MIRTPSARSAMKSHPEHSLFKFSLHFHPSSEESVRKNGKPWIWYSFDLREERDLFLPALSNAMRQQWTDILQRFWKHENLYLFFRDCYPQEEDGRLVIYFATARAPEIQALSIAYGNYVRSCFAQLGIQDYILRHQEDSIQIPGKCPSRLQKDFYGIRAFETNTKVVQWLASNALLNVKVYDNRCYHSENEYGTILPPQPLAEPVLAGKIIENVFRRAV